MTEDNPITGVKYDIVEIPDTMHTKRYTNAYNRIQKIKNTYITRIRKNRQKHK